jgi:hypothetical protein
MINSYSFNSTSTSSISERRGASSLRMFAFKAVMLIFRQEIKPSLSLSSSSNKYWNAVCLISALICYDLGLVNIFGSSFIDSTREALAFS